MFKILALVSMLCANVIIGTRGNIISTDPNIYIYGMNIFDIRVAPPLDLLLGALSLSMCMFHPSQYNVVSVWVSLYQNISSHPLQIGPIILQGFMVLVVGRLIALDKKKFHHKFTRVIMWSPNRNFL